MSTQTNYCDNIYLSNYHFSISTLSAHFAERRGRFYFFFSNTQAVKILPFPHPWRCPSLVPRNNRVVPLLFRSPCFCSSFLSPPKKGEGCFSDSVHLRCERTRRKMRNPDSHRLPSVIISLRCSFLLLEFIHFVQPAGLWPPQSIFFHACLSSAPQLRLLLVFLRGVSVR